MRLAFELSRVKLFGFWAGSCKARSKFGFAADKAVVSRALWPSQCLCACNFLQPILSGNYAVEKVPVVGHWVLPGEEVFVRLAKEGIGEA